MNNDSILKGFSRLTREQKIQVLAKMHKLPDESIENLGSYTYSDYQLQTIFEEISENTISNFHLPFGVAPNFNINGKLYTIPMVIEESSVVAAASKSAKFWADHGGFHAQVTDTIKHGQVHFIWNGQKQKLFFNFPSLKTLLMEGVSHISERMEKRGGGILNIQLIDYTHKIDNYYQLDVTFETVDAMGANFINSVLEEFAILLQEDIKRNPVFEAHERDCKIIMSILSNYNPECLVTCSVKAPVTDFTGFCPELTAEEFVWKFEKAIEIANIDVFRATTHNKGIFNGIDAVVAATGNDHRAVEAGGHAYAARLGYYRGLTDISVKNGLFEYSLTIPLTLGTIGGLTRLHPLAAFSLQLLGNPSAKELMMIAAAAGLANNFGAVSSLVTHGIQKGHMKMHLSNIINHLNANIKERELIIQHFTDKVVSFSAVEKYLNQIRKIYIKK